tara:strand:+ start:284 stop:649 length:366 start_codon:yes stop_codon:yes gene_type:complete
MGSYITQATMGGNILEVITGRFGGVYNPGADGGNRVSVPELLGLTKDGFKIENVGGRYGTRAGSGTSFTEAVMNNLKANGVKSLIGLTVTPVIFKVVRKQAGPFSRMFNKTMRMAGVPLRF